MTTVKYQTYASIEPLEPSGMFDEEGDSESRLSATLTLRVGTSEARFHLELIEVDDAGRAVNPALDDDVERIADGCGVNPNELTRIEVGGHSYIGHAVIYAQ